MLFKKSSYTLNLNALSYTIKMCISYSNFPQIYTLFKILAPKWDLNCFFKNII